LVHDQPSEGVAKANVWMIDFGKTTPLNGDKALDHRTPWVEGTYLENLLSIIYIFNKVNLMIVTLTFNFDNKECKSYYKSNIMFFIRKPRRRLLVRS